MRLDKARDRDREGQRPLAAVRADQRQEKEELLLGRYLARPLVHEIEALGARVEGNAEVGAHRRDEALCVRDRLVEGNGGRRRSVLSHVGMRGDHLDSQRAEDDRQDERGGRVGVVHHDPGTPSPGWLDVERSQKVFRVHVRRTRRIADLPHFVQAARRNS